MKRVGVVISISIVITTILLGYLQFGREMEICSSRSKTSGDIRLKSISVVANTLFISDKEEFAKQIVQKCTENSFEEIKFSYDVGYPNRLIIVVYLNETEWKDGNENFIICFVQDEESDYQYNIVENPEKFQIEIINSSE